MSKINRPPLRERILAGARDAAAHAAGDTGRARVTVPEEVDVRAIRARTGLSQRDFALRYGFAIDSLQNWEAGRRRPTGAARTLLLVIDRQPKAVERALQD